MKSADIHIRNPDGATRSLFPPVATGGFEELGFLCEQDLRHSERGCVFRLVLVDDDSQGVGEVDNTGRYVNTQILKFAGG